MSKPCVDKEYEKEIYRIEGKPKWATTFSHYIFLTYQLSISKTKIFAGHLSRIQSNRSFINLHKVNTPESTPLATNIASLFPVNHKLSLFFTF